MILSDTDIIREISSGRIGIEPYSPKQLQPSSVDLRLARQFRIFANYQDEVIDPRQEQDLTRVVDVGERPFVLHPGEFVLASTVERLTLPDNVVGRLEGKSSLGRIGLLIHATAGFFDPGFQGTATLELSNVARLPIRLYPGMAICQISYAYTYSPATRPYGSSGLGSKYQGQDGPTSSAYHRNWTD